MNDYSTSNIATDYLNAMFGYDTNTQVVNDSLVNVITDTDPVKEGKEGYTMYIPKDIKSSILYTTLKKTDVNSSLADVKSRSVIYLYNSNNQDYVLPNVSKQSTIDLITENDTNKDINKNFLPNLTNTFTFPDGSDDNTIMYIGYIPVLEINKAKNLDNVIKINLITYTLVPVFATTTLTNIKSYKELVNTDYKYIQNNSQYLA